jgi:acetoin utilization protein AcuC
MSPSVCVFVGKALAGYHFGDSHPFGPKRHGVFVEALRAQGLDARVRTCKPVPARDEDLALFHTPEYLSKVRKQSITGSGYLDYGDTPAVRGIYGAAAAVVGTTLAAVDQVMAGTCRRAFVPIAGLHHARRDRAAGFCVFNDCGVAIEHLRRHHGVRRIAYVDIDAHHGDGVFYAYEDDPDLRVVDFHEDGRYLYPGSGSLDETGTGAAAGTKMNLPMPPGAGDALFMKLWEPAERFLRETRPEFILLQGGADSLAGDPLTHLQYSEAAHAHATRRLCVLADEYCGGRLVALGGGGYDPDNIARAWIAVVEAMLPDETPAPVPDE